MLSFVDGAIVEFDRMLRTLLAPGRSARPCPGSDAPEVELDDDQRARVSALMRVNHCGEVCAQGLYQGQALTARSPELAAELRKASEEESDHLAWTEIRLRQLGGRTSFLSPMFYVGSLALGAVAGRMGDRWSLGFLAETERQVEAHLKGHLEKLPEADHRSRAILEQMESDEVRHGQTAIRLGGQELPAFARNAMWAAARVMTTTTYWV